MRYYTDPQKYSDFILKWTYNVHDIIIIIIHLLA